MDYNITEDLRVEIIDKGRVIMTYLGPKEGGLFTNKEEASAFAKLMVQSLDVQQAKATRDAVVKTMINKVLGLKRHYNKADIIYNGHKFKADRDSIQATQNECINMNPDEPIPVNNGCWESLELQDDGATPVCIPFTCGEFIQFASMLFKRVAKNFEVCSKHQTQLRLLANNPDVPIKDILAYDYTQGDWETGEAD